MPDPVAISSIESRMTHSEIAMERLTANVSTLTRDVQTMVDSQKEMNQLIKNQALQSKDLQHFSEGLRRAFNRIEAIESETKSISQSVTNINNKFEIQQAKMSVVSFIIKHWPILTAVAAVAASSGAAVKTALGAG